MQATCAAMVCTGSRLRRQGSSPQALGPPESPPIAAHQEEVNRPLAAVHTHLKPILLSPYDTGMRRGELVKLTWKRSGLQAA
jgi:integrase